MAEGRITGFERGAPVCMPDNTEFIRRILDMRAEALARAAAAVASDIRRRR